MKLIVSLLLICGLQAGAHANAQSITLHMKRAKLQTVFKELWTQSGYDFVYDKNLLKQAADADISVSNVSLETALEACFAAQPLTWEIKNKLIIVKRKETTAITAPQDIDVRGRVLDDKGDPLAGASIKSKSSGATVTTGTDGSFVLNNIDPRDQLEISYVGYKTVTVTAKSDLGSIRLTLANAKLDEVVVVAYGTQKKQGLTGAISSVNTEQLGKQQITSVTQGLQGLTAGVLVLNSSGQPGTAPVIRVRGVSSINASSSPLLVVDGIPYDGNINTINPADVETMSVLKDASAASLYGSRAANGVIMITTRKGKAGQEPVINLTASYGVSARAIKEYEYVSAENYMKLAWEAQKNFAQSSGIAAAGKYASDNLITGNSYGLKYNPYNMANPIDTNGNLVAGAGLLWNTDWEREARSSSIARKNVGISFAGGNEKYRYYISGNYLDQDGVVLRSNYRRFTTRFNGDANLKSWLRVGINTTIASNNDNTPRQSGGPYSNAVQFSRLVSSIYPLYRRDAAGQLVYDAAGKPIYDYGSGVTGQTINASRPTAAAANSNAISTLMLDKNTGSGLQTSLNAFGEIIFTPHLKFRSNIGADRFYNETLGYTNPLYGDAAPVKGRVRRDQTFTSSWTWNNMFTWDRSYGDHTFGAMASMEAYDLRVRTTAVGTTGFPVPGLEEVSAGATKETTESNTLRNRLTSYLGRLTYGYNNRYFFEGTIRTDGSTRWHKDKRWGMFYAIGGSWVVSNEAFMKNQTIFDQLKLRASYGELGNQALSDYFPYLTVYTTGYNDLSFPGIYNAAIGNNDLSWEKLGTWNVGLDMAFLKNRIDLSIEYYYKNTFDLIFTKPKAGSTGVQGIIDNIGKLRNTGIELIINSRNIVTRNFKWNTSFNLTTVKNTIAALPQQFIISGNKRLEVGRSYNEFWIYEWAGVNPDNGKPQWYADDPNNPGKSIVVNQLGAAGGLPAARRSYQGSSIPKITGGFYNSFTLQNFDLSFLFNYAFGGKVLDTDYIRLMHGFSRLGASLSTDIMSRWQKPGDITDVPKLSFATNEWDGNPSTRNLFSGDYIRLRNVTLGYTLPASALRLSNNVVKSLRIFAQADNYFTWTRLKKGTDPELSIDGATSNSSSAFKTISVGITAGF